MLVFAMLLTVAAPDAGDSRIRTVVVDQKAKQSPIALAVGAGTTTSIKLNRPIAAGTLSLGQPDSFFMEVNEAQSQINLKAKPSKTGVSTNLNVPTKTGEFVAFELTTTADSKKADIFVSVNFEGAAPAPTRIEPKAGEECTRDCELKGEASLLKGAADVLSYRHIDERGIHGDIILKVIAFVKIGERGFIRFEVENRSRDTWVAGEAKLSFAVPGREPTSVDVNHAFKQLVVERGESTPGAVSFDMYDLPANARFRLQAFEKNGTRHPEVAGVRL